MDDLKQIKKDYGEGMMHLCRSLFPTLLETPGLLYKVISEHFAKSKDLYTDIVSEYKEYIFKEYIYSFVDVEKEAEKKEVKTVKELLAEAGYKLFECKTNDDIKKFIKYYAERETLCTFRDPHRIDNYYIFFIVKKDVNKIKREDFEDPRREDKYSTSVLDLQFDKGERQRVSIKSRYNHTVTNPDATYSNNLDAIKEGLTDAFERDYGFNIGSEYKTNFELKDYVEARDGKLYKYNYEIINTHYCPNNIIIDDGRVIDTYSKEPERHLLMDYFILDLKEKKWILYNKRMSNSFIDGLQNIIDIKVTNKEGYKEVRLILEENKEAIINLDKRGRIIGYTNNYLEQCGNGFLQFNNSLQTLNLPNLKECGNNFLKFCTSLISLDLSNLIRCGSYFLDHNLNLQTLSLPNLKECGDNFLACNRIISSINLSNLIRCGHNFLEENKNLRTLSLSKLEICGYNFLYFNHDFQSISLPSLNKECYGYLKRDLVLLLKKQEENVTEKKFLFKRIFDYLKSRKKLRLHKQNMTGVVTDGELIKNKEAEKVYKKLL